MRGPTVVAFFEPVSLEQLDKDPDMNVALADFQFYAETVRAPLRKAGIEFHELYTHSFRLRIGTQSITFRPAKITVGYYFVAPGKKPHIEYGVRTDADILQVANAYFGTQRSEKTHESHPNAQRCFAMKRQPLTISASVFLRDLSG